MAKKLENYVSEFELIFETPNEYKLSTLIDAINLQITSNKFKETEHGTFYVKNIKELTKSYILLFGKDNPDASNHKRNKKNLTIDKVNVDEKTEVLTDYIHVGISKKNSRRDGKFVHKVFMEKSSLFRVHSLKYYINAISENPMLTSLQKRAITEFYNQVRLSKKIMSITQVQRDIDNPLPIDAGDNEVAINDVIITKELTYKPTRKAGTVAVDVFDKICSKKETKSSLYVKIQDESGSVININFDNLDAKYAVKYNIPINTKQDNIQDDIAKVINHLMTL
ncbi:hypothetical protein ACN9J3_04895 [Aliarcobacter butzleri]|uniref:hypothetical protein n=1 Tax=Aliarcobacter butzleri TaxID=28197 RepID=UPI003B21FA0E